MMSDPPKSRTWGLLILVMFAVAGCGGDDDDDRPPGAVAVVDEHVITRGDFDRWMNTAAVFRALGGPAVVPDPPRFSKCIREMQRRPVPKRQPKPTREDLRKRCELEYTGLKRQVLRFLIRAEWIQREAARLELALPDGEVERVFQSQKEDGFDSDGEYRAFLARSGLREDDLKFRLKIESLEQKLTAHVGRSLTPITDRDVRSYYQENRKRFPGKSLREAREHVRQGLQAERRQAAQARLQRSLGRRYRAITSCAVGFRTSDCANGPSKG